MNKKWQIDPKVIKHDKTFSTMYKLFITHQNNLDNSNKIKDKNIGHNITCEWIFSYNIFQFLTHL